jgi:hypothetical protein
VKIVDIFVLHFGKIPYLLQGGAFYSLRKIKQFDDELMLTADCQYPAQLMGDDMGVCPNCSHAFCTRYTDDILSLLQSQFRPGSGPRERILSSVSNPSVARDRVLYTVVEK